MRSNYLVKQEDVEKIFEMLHETKDRFHNDDKFMSFIVENNGVLNMAFELDMGKSKMVKSIKATLDEIYEKHGVKETLWQKFMAYISN